MSKRIVAFLLAFIIVLSVPVSAAGAEDFADNSCISQLLFGDDAYRYEASQSYRLLMDGLYLCSEQADGSGQDALDRLRDAGVRKLPELSAIDLPSDALPECGHGVWEAVSASHPEAQQERHTLLMRTVNKVFDFGFFQNLFCWNKGKSAAFSALLYDLNILDAYLSDETAVDIDGQNVGMYFGQPYAELNGNIPAFTEQEKSGTAGYLNFSPLDSLGRCGPAEGCLGPETICSEPRGEIGMIKPSGWHTIRYDGLVEGKYLYNRCHLIAFMLSGENANEQNLITGTRYLNTVGMLPFENKVNSYIKDTGNHVFYRVTPVFLGSNLVASGVQMEAWSVEDGGKGVCFNVYCYNVQPGIVIYYPNGESSILRVAGKQPLLSFAVPRPDAENPDLLYETEQHLHQLFRDQQGTAEYIALLQQICLLAQNARALGSQGESSTEIYYRLREYEWEFYEILREYLPGLLKKEAFFTSAFR